MTLSEKIGLINEVCDNIEKLNNKDAKHYESEVVKTVIKMETQNIQLVRNSMVLDALNGNDEKIKELQKKLTEEES